MSMKAKWLCWTILFGLVSGSALLAGLLTGLDSLIFTGCGTFPYVLVFLAITCSEEGPLRFQKPS